MKQTLIFGDQCIEKSKFYVYKETVKFYGIDIKKTILSSKYSYGDEGDHKFYIGYI